MANTELINLNTMLSIDNHVYRDGRLHMYDSRGRKYKEWVPPAPSNMIHVSFDGRVHEGRDITIPDTLFEVVDCGPCGTIVLGWTLCS